MWHWQTPNGKLKDISCRDMLRELDKAGRIRLPAPLKASRSAGSADVIRHFEHDTTPIIQALPKLRPLCIENVGSSAKLAVFKSYLSQYHYLGFDRTIGENMKYMVSSRDGKPLSCLLFGSAAWSCRERDEFIGWDKGQRAHGLSNMTNNTRFLIYPWVRVAHLASHILSLIALRVADDWQAKYRAANWIYVGRTTGRGRDGGHKHAILPIKDIYLYPLTKHFREVLTVAE